MTDERTPLDAEIRARIAQTGPMPVAEFMAMCLYDPRHGYYGHRSPFGAALAACGSKSSKANSVATMRHEARAAAPIRIFRQNATTSTMERPPRTTR